MELLGKTLIIFAAFMGLTLILIILLTLLLIFKDLSFEPVFQLITEIKDSDFKNFRVFIFLIFLISLIVGLMVD